MTLQDTTTASRASKPDTAPPAHDQPAPSQAAQAGEPTTRRQGGRSLAALAGAGIALTGALAAYAVHSEGLLALPRLPISPPAEAWLPLAAALTCCAGAALSVAAVRAFRQALARHGAADLATFAAAAMASVVSGSGMWVFFAAYIPLPSALRCVVFAFLEVAVLSAALRARDNMREFGAAGVDGLLMWVLTAGSALLASTAATSVPEALLRLIVPLVAALLWERVLVTEKRRREGGAAAPSRWRQFLARYGLAAPQVRTIGEAVAAARVASLALAAARVAALEEAGAKAGGWRLRRAVRRREAVLRAAVEHAGLASDARLQAELAAEVRMLGSASELPRLATAAPWAWLPPETAPADDDGGLGELAGELAGALHQGDASRVRALLDGRDDHVELARLVAGSGFLGAKRVLAAIALHANPDARRSQKAITSWLELVTSSEDLPEPVEIRRVRSLVWPEQTDSALAATA